MMSENEPFQALCQSVTVRPTTVRPQVTNSHFAAIAGSFFIVVLRRDVALHIAGERVIRTRSSGKRFAKVERLELLRP